ncbi:organic solute transporter Ostalpha-domain-containing protein [Gautieria morchelliformis]|nr:organic solute transporter Ostalpha-domain-containing protein [Gautieria morchelliformis]
MANATAQRCFTQRAPFSGPPLIQNGRLSLQTHDVGWIVAGIFTVVATVVSFWIIGKHLMWYTKKRQQRYIVRLLLMVPIYAIVSLASYIFWNHAIPITLVRDSYESFVLYSFFYLLLQYLSPTTEGQKEVFRNVVLSKWIFPLRFVKYRPKDGLYFLQLMKWGVLQYCVVRPATTLAAVILDFIGLYCDRSWSPGWGHIYITIVVSASVTIAMYCLFQLYIPIAEHLTPHKPLLKLFSVKAVVFLTFWQATGLSVLSMFGVVKDTPYMTADDINTGIAAILETFEMMCFGVLHVRAFSYKTYCIDGQAPSQTPRLRSLIHALDIRDLWREIRDGSVYMTKTIRGAEPERGARRRTHFARVMGREREFIEAKDGARESRYIDEYIYDEELLLDSRARERHSRQDAWLNEAGGRSASSSEDTMRRKRKGEFTGGKRILD